MKKITLLWREAETTGEWELRLSTDPSGAPAPAHAASGAAGRINKSMISVGAIERSLKTPELMQACTASRRTKASMSVLNSARYSALCAQGRVPARDQSPLAARPRSWSPRAPPASSIQPPARACCGTLSKALWSSARRRASGPNDDARSGDHGVEPVLVGTNPAGFTLGRHEQQQATTAIVAVKRSLIFRKAGNYSGSCSTGSAATSST
jgi:hypothetical protein